MKKFKRILRKVKAKYRDSRYIWWFYHNKIDENMVLIESKHGNDLAGNMFYILKEIKDNYNEYKVYLVVNKRQRSKIINVLEEYNINNVSLVIKNSLNYFKILSIAKYLFNDTSFSANFIKKEGQVYVNTWHGTPLKNMGKDVLGRAYAIGNVKRNFLMSDYLVYPNVEMEKKMLAAYGLSNLYNGEILNVGYPRNSVFFDKKNRDVVREKFGFGKKQIIVYMPTWKGVMTNRSGNKQEEEIMERMKVIDSMLNDNQVLYVKMHVLVQRELCFDSYSHIKGFPDGVETYEFLNAADILITDYSSVFFDFANSGRKIIMYTYDEADYTSLRGFYYSLEDLPFPKVKTEEDLIREINSPKGYDEALFLKGFCTFDSKYAVSDLLKYVFNGKKSKRLIVKKCENKVPNTLIYTSTLPLNGLTSSLLSLMNVIDNSKENISFCFRERAIRRFPERVNKLPSFGDIYPICSGFKYSFMELLAYILYYKFNVSNKFVISLLDRLYEREIKRFFGDVKFDRVIHFTGYEKRMVGLFQRFDAKRAIFVHSDMDRELKMRNNHHRLTLVEAYNKYDKVAVVSESAKESVIKLVGKDLGNIVTVNNAHNYERVLKLADEEIKFDDITVSNVSENVLKKIMEMDCKKFITIGRFSVEKGHDRLIDAFLKYYQRNNNSFLIIIGGHGNLYDDTLARVKKLDCRYNVIFVKNISNPYAILKKCDLFILSSFYEALGLVLLEADTCGVPCFSTDIMGPREFLMEHNGNLVDNSSDGIFEGMLEFDKGNFKCMNFDAEKYNEKVKKQYEEIFK